MSKSADSLKLTVIGTGGKVNHQRAERLEIDFGNNRRLLLTLPEEGWGDLEIEAEMGESDAVVPIINIQPTACNVINLRVEARRDFISLDDNDTPGIAAPPTLTLTVQKALEDADRVNAPKKHQIRRWLQAALERTAEVTVRLVGEAEGLELNKTYRGKDAPTNILTFTYKDADTPEDAPLAGDLVLCIPVAAREAKEQKKSLNAHLAHLIVHGMLHLQGFDHQKEAEAEIMENREREVLRSLGYADPYQGT